MSERGQERRVTPTFLLEFVDPNVIANTPARENVKPSYAHRAMVSFRDSVTGLDKFLVISSNDERLVKDMSQAARYQDKDMMTEDRWARILKLYAVRLPDASIWYDDKGSFIKCEEPSCRHHVGGGCTNENVRIQDDCPGFNYCMTYEPEVEQS